MAYYTKNYNLKKPLPNEFYDVEDQNGNMDILDTVLANHQNNTDVHFPKGGILPVERGGTGGVTAADARVKLGAAGNPNLLDNWYFADPINQRGNTEYTTSGYTIDRWKLNLWNDTEPRLRIANQGIILSNDTPEGTPATCMIAQEIENTNLFVGKTMTFSVLLGDVSKGNGIVQIDIFKNGSTVLAYKIIEVESANTIVSVTFVIPDDTTNLWLRIGQDANRSGGGTFELHLKAAKLEIGEKQTLTRQENSTCVLNDAPPNKQQELTKCQRYFQTFATQSLRPTDAMDFRPVMRVTPALGTIAVNGKTLYTASADL